MKRLSIRQLKIVRNVVSVIGIVVGILLWKYLPDTFRNNGLFHVGNGEYGSKYGALIILVIQFFAFIPNTNIEEIHTDNPEERAKLEEKRTRLILEKQVMTAIAMALTIWGVTGLAALLL